MRLELAGSLIHPDPLVTTYLASGTFDTQAFIDLGFTHFEVICIGAGGGKGGRIDTNNTGTLIKNYGGEGGGGGYHRVRGLLSALPASCPIVVGVAGAAGTSHASNPASTTDGADGGASTFNTNTCRASGGKGGKRAQSNSSTVSTQANGGDGGAGNRILAGGGAAGGVAGTPTATGPGTPGTPGVDGSVLNNIGKGGGGGAGGVGLYTGVTCNAATAGGRGSFNPGDTSVYAPAGSVTADPVLTTEMIVPGSAGGSKAAPLNGLPLVYGRSDSDGAVIIRLTVDVTNAKTSTVTPPINTVYGTIINTLSFLKDVIGRKTTRGQVAASFGFGRTVAGIKSTKTPVAEISLASHVAPAVRNNHSIKVRARAVSGSTGVLYAALYEGSTNRSGDLATPVLTNALADYTLTIPNTAAAAITSYANLSIKIWGFQPTGAATVFEVANLYLQLPSA